MKSYAQRGRERRAGVWIDPSTWKLPSGKALAEFALEAGFLAPHMLSHSRKKPSAKRKLGSVLRLETR